MTTDRSEGKLGKQRVKYRECQQSGQLARFDELFGKEDPRPELSEAANVLIGVRETEFRAYLSVIDHPKSTATEISDALDTAYTNTHQYLTNLRENGLVSRQSVVADCEGGGHKYEYEAQSLAETRQQIQEEIDEWSETIEDQMTALQDPLN